MEKLGIILLELLVPWEITISPPSVFLSSTRMRRVPIMNNPPYIGLKTRIGKMNANVQRDPLKITVWYNPKCGTCQKVRATIEARGHRPRLVEYLKAPPSVEEIDEVCRKLDLEPQQLARQKESIYDSIAKKCKTRQDWLRALH